MFKILEIWEICLNIRGTQALTSFPEMRKTLPFRNKLELCVSGCRGQRAIPLVKNTKNHTGSTSCLKGGEKISVHLSKGHYFQGSYIIFPVYSNILLTHNLPEYLVIDEVSQFHSFIMSIGQTKLKMCIEVLFTAVHTNAFIFIRVSRLGTKACFKKQYLSQGIYVSFQMMFKLCTSSVTIIS